MSIYILVIDLGKKEHPNLTYTALSRATLRGGMKIQGNFNLQRYSL